MTWLLLAAAWLLADLLLAPFVGRYLKHISPTDAPTGRNGERP